MCLKCRINLIIVKHALERLDHLIAIEINPQKNNNLKITNSHSEKWTQTAKDEIEYIARYLLRRSVKLKKEKEIELLVQQYQGNIILFLDKVFIYKSTYTSPLYLHLFDSILQQLDELLSHIEQRYYRHFNQKEKVPDCYLHLVQEEMAREIKKVNKFILKSIDQKLGEIILKPIKTFIKTKNGSISYKQMIYMKTLVREIIQLPLQESISKDIIIQSLIYWNYNSTSFINFAIENIRHELNLTQNENISQLTDQLKKINLLVMKPGAALYQHKPSTKERIQGWLLEEINFIQVQQTLFIRPAPMEKDAEDFRINTSLSVQQLALWIRAAKDTGMIINKNHTALLRTMARIFTTPHSEKISPESLRIKSYINEKSAQNALKDLLMKMYKQVHNYVFLVVLLQTIY
jgi:hypothetical protein